MTIIISNDEECQEALDEIWSVIDAVAGSEEEKRLLQLTEAVEAYEDIHFPMPSLEESIGFVEERRYMDRELVVLYTDDWTAVYVNGELVWVHRHEEGVDPDGVAYLIEILTKDTGTVWRESEESSPPEACPEIGTEE